jgi:hypothetical protein
MTRYSAQQLRDGAVRFFGAFDFDERPAGISPRRLPAWTRAQLPKALDDMLRMPSGVRMAFTTDSRLIRLLVQTTRLVTPPQPPRPVVFDLVVDGTTVQSRAFEGGNTILLDRADPTRFELRRGDAYEVVFSDLAAGRRRCELWLPHNAYSIPAWRSMRARAGGAAVPGQRRWIHYGSSISHCMGCATHRHLAGGGRSTGSGPAEPGLWRPVPPRSLRGARFRDAQADLISIKAGINVINADSMRERVLRRRCTASGHDSRGAADTPIVLVSPIFLPQRRTPSRPDAARCRASSSPWPGTRPSRPGA